MAGPASAPRNHLVFFINGVKHVARDVQPETTLVQYLRTQELVGTKQGCAEGGCGACTVMVSTFDHANKEIKHAAVNACLTPVCSVDWCHVTTVEGVGSMRQGLHPVQKRIAEMHGSQCGYCTPGMVMALYALLRSNPSASAEDIEKGLDGNLCRCTGYRPILDAAKSLGKDGGGLSGCCRGGDGGCPCLDAKLSADSPDASDKPVDDDGTPTPGGVTGSVMKECTVSRARDPRFHERYSDRTEPVFPPELMLSAPSATAITGECVTWHCPTSLKELLRLKASCSEARIVAGNTALGIKAKFEGKHFPVLISSARVPELHTVSEDPKNGGVFIGGAVPLSAVERALAECDGPSERPGGAARACVDMLRWFGSTQIRNVACLAGGLATATPTSDMNALLAACGADVVLESTRGGERRVKVRSFFVGKGKVAMELDEVIVGVFLPTADCSTENNGPTRAFEFVRPFKQARRRQGDVSIVTAGMRVKLEARDGKWVVGEAALCFGGMASTTAACPITEAFLMGKEWSAEVMTGAYKTLAEDLPLPLDAKGGRCEYRRALPPSFLFKFFVEVATKLETLLSTCDGDMPPAPTIGGADRSAATSFVTAPKASSRGHQEYNLRKGGLQKARPEPHVPAKEGDSGLAGGASVAGGVGRAVPHKSASLQVTGEAVYTDDMPSPAGTLYAGLVLSSKPHAKILEVDPSEALKMGGVLRFVGAGDVTPERNAIGVVQMDEQAFAADEVHCVGQIIGAVLADSPILAEKAAKLVVVRYEDLPALVTIEEAIAANSYLNRHVLKDGNVEAALADADVIVEGELKIGGQEHFYLETHAVLAVPGEGGSLEVFASTQNVTGNQSLCAKVCGIDKNKVVCRVKRLGGGFGGKDTRSAALSCVVALAAHITERPVRLRLDRGVDMQITGQRHPVLAKYKAGASKDGKLCALDVTVYSNGGYSLDLSSAIMERLLLQIDNCYRWPTTRVVGLVCKTNQASNTSFRGFGGPQAILISETVIDHLAASVGVKPITLRTVNMYKEGEATHFGQPLEAWNIPDAWSDIQRWAETERRREEVDEFNTGSRWRKRGFAVIPTKMGINFEAGFLNQGGALVHVYLDGTVLVSHGGIEMGQGLHTKVCQVVAVEFGIDMDKVHIAETSTDRVPNSSCTAASVSTDLYCMATLDACEQITERLKPIAAQLPPGAPFASIVTAAYFQRVNLSAQGFYITPQARCSFDFHMETDNNSDRGTPYNYFTQGIAASEVEVDCLTGDVRVLRTDILMDVGASINPAIDIGQIEGAFMQGYGWCTMEEVIWGDAEHPWVKRGELHTRGPGSYKIPSSNDVPLDMRIRFMDRKNAFAVHSSKAIGEPPFLLSSSAFFAIKDAIASARRDHGEAGYFQLMSPASSERIRTSCLDNFVETALGNADVAAKDYQAKGSL